MTLTSFQSVNVRHTEVLTNDIMRGNFNILSFHFLDTSAQQPLNCVMQSSKFPQQIDATFSMKKRQ